MPNNRSKPWELRAAGGRNANIRPRRRVLILCEDTKSSVFYFNGFQIDARRVEVCRVGTGLNTDSLVEDAINRKNAAARAGQPYNDVWCVFDRDSFPPQNFNRAFKIADNNNINVAWANEAFELWYLLHFNYYDGGMSRTEYGQRLSDLLHCAYSKADETIYEKLIDHQPKAIKNAQRLEKHWQDMGGCNPVSANPSTNIHELVIFLKQFEEIGPADTD